MNSMHLSEAQKSFIYIIKILENYFNHLHRIE